MLKVIGRAPELTASAEPDDQGKDFKTESDKTLSDVGVLADDTPDQVQEKPILMATDQYLGRLLIHHFFIIDLLHLNRPISLLCEVRILSKINNFFLRSMFKEIGF